MKKLILLFSLVISTNLFSVPKREAYEDEKPPKGTFRCVRSRLAEKENKGSDFRAVANVSPTGNIHYSHSLADDFDLKKGLRHFIGLEVDRDRGHGSAILERLYNHSPDARRVISRLQQKVYEECQEIVSRGDGDGIHYIYDSVAFLGALEERERIGDKQAHQILSALDNEVVNILNDR